MVYYDATKCHIAITRRSQLTAWRNADVKIVSGDCIPTDQFIGATVTYPTPITTRMGTLGATRIKHRITTGRTTGKFVGDFYFQTAQFIYWIMQVCSTTTNRAEVTSVTCGATASLTTADYFFINCVNGAGATVANYVWFQIDAAGADPAPGGTGIEVDIVTGDTAAQVATKLKDKMDAEGNYGASVADTVVTITNANAGAVVDASDGNTDFTIATTTQGTSKHAITASATQVPISLGIHIENEMTAEDRRNDLLGLVPEELVISCNASSEGWTATQRISIPFSFALRGVSGDAVDDIAAQTKRPEATEGSVKKDHNHAVNGDLWTGFKYNGTAVECDIYGVTITLTNTTALKKFDATGYAALGKLKNWEYTVELIVMPTGDDLFKIANTKKASYAGDLDLIFSFKNTANDYVKFTFDKMYLVPFDVDAVRETDWFEGYTITLEPLDNTSSLAIEGIDSLDDDHYEDP